jgi:hypothetical protein
MESLAASNRPMKGLGLTLLCLAMLSLGCGSSTEDVWGGYTEGEVKDLLSDPQFRDEVMRTAPPDPRGPIHLLYPTNEEIESADLQKVTVQGEENWEYRDEENQWCIYVGEDTTVEGKQPIYQIGPCIAD